MKRYARNQHDLVRYTVPALNCRNWTKP